MSDILIAWLSKEAGLQVDQVEKEFANGYLWGQLFSHFNLQPDFERFENKRSPDAMVSNFTRLQPTFKRLGITMNTRVANSLMREEAGVAMRLLYSVKQNLAQINKDLEKYKHSGRLGRELGTSLSVSRTLLEATQYRSPKQTYEKGGMRFFEETMRGQIPESGKHMMESMHLRRFSEKQYKMEASMAAASDAERAETVGKTQAFRDGLLTGMTKKRTDKSKQLERDAAVHASLMRSKEELEKEDLRVELALAEASRRRKAEAVQLATQDVNHGIDTFEINMKRLLKGGDYGDEKLAPATTHSPLEHQAKLQAMATSTSKLLEETAGYMGSVLTKRADDMATKREREARRRRMLVEQQAAASEAECKAEAEALLQTLVRQSKEEQRLATRLWQLSQEKEVMRENRELREQQYAERRAQDWEHTLRRELELHRSMRQAYEAQTEAEMATWNQAQEQRAQAKAAKHLTMCESMAWQVVQVAERVIEYRQKTGQLVPRNEWRRWMTMFVTNDNQLGDPVVKSEQERPKLDGVMARAAVADWLACLGEFEREGVEPIAPNAGLGALVADLDNLARPEPEHTANASIKQLPLKMAVVGPPFAGKTSIAQALARQFNLRVLDPEVLVQAAITAAQAWTDSNVPAPDAAPPAPPADGETGEAPAAAPEPPQPSRYIEMGLALQAALQAGLSLPDEAVVPIVVHAMEETLTWTPPPPPEEEAAKGAKGKPAAKPAKGAPPEEPPKPVQGFILDGFPRTAQQAALLEKALTGLDLESEQAIVDSASQLAPPPQQALPQLNRLLISGLDAMLVLGLTDPEAALKRALGRRLDPNTGRVYHLEFDPPPATDVGLAARLKEVADPSNDAVQVQQRLLSYSSVGSALEDWNKRFNRLRRPIDGSGSVQDVISAASDAAQGVLRAKAAVTSCRAAAEAAQKAKVAAEKAREYAELARSHAEGAALELLVAKKAEVQAQALLDGTADAGAATGKKDAKGKAAPASAPDPAAVELLKAQSAAKCAEQLKVCRGAASDAAGYAERAGSAATTAAEAVERARMSLGDAEVSATAEVDARAAADTAEAAQAGAAEAASKAEAAKQAAEQACNEATKFADVTTVEPDVQLELAPPAEGQAGDAAAAAAAAKAEADAKLTSVPGRGLLTRDLADVFLQEFKKIESGYLQGISMILLNMLERNDLAVSHYDKVRQKFKELLATPDERAVLVAKFQKEFNAIEVDVRKQPETQAELVLRSEELREAIWALCDKKMDCVESEKAAVASDTFVADQSAILSQYYTALAQVELDRLYGTLSFIKGYVPVKHGILQPAGSPPASDITSASPDLASGVPPPELKDQLDEKSKSALPIPAPLTQLAAKSPSLAGALKVAYAAGTAATNALLPQPEDPKAKKDTKKDAGKGGKGAAAAETAPAEEVPPQVQEAINAELAALAAQEMSILQARLQLLAHQATAALEGLQQLNGNALDTVSGWIKAKYQAECSAALALDRHIKAVALSGEQLAAELRLEDDGTVAVVDANQMVVPTHPPYPPPKPKERPPPASVLTVAQLGALTQKMLAFAPGGYIKVGELADMLLQAAGAGELPDAWQGLSVTALQAALRLLDPTYTEYVDWREVLVCLMGSAFPVILSASCADMADQCEMLLEGDKDKDGLMAEEEWLAIELWFQYRAFQAGSAADLEGEHATEESKAAAKKVEFDRASALKQVLWNAFSSPAPASSPVAGSPRLDLRALLLYLSADRDQFQGIKKAFSVSANSIASNAKINATQLHKVAYPYGTESGQALQKCPLDQEALAQVVNTIYQSRGGTPDTPPVITAEQLIYGAYGEKVVSHLLGRYQWHDLYVASKTALF